jgi:hypothetical protein
VVGVVLAFAVGAYGISQLLSISQPPPLSIETPTEGMVSGPIVTVSGKSTGDALVTINSKPVSLDMEGRFETTLDLSPGDHTIVITAEFRDGKATTESRRVSVERP